MFAVYDGFGGSSCLDYISKVRKTKNTKILQKTSKNVKNKIKITLKSTKTFL